MTDYRCVSPAGRGALAAIAADPARTLLALDYDGTLAPIVADPERAFPHPDALAALGRLGGLVGDVALVTGRAARAVVGLGGLAGRDGLGRLVVLGQYGVERWDAATGAYDEPPAPAAIIDVARELPAVLAAAGRPDAAVEDKGRALGVHTRGLVDPVGALAALAEPIRALAARHGLEVQEGRLVWEIRAAHSDKGRALAAHVADVGARVVVFAGDDLGDLPAFDALDAMEDEGLTAIRVCSASVEQPVLAERADIVCDGPAGIARWLADLADAIERAGTAGQ